MPKKSASSASSPTPSNRAARVEQLAMRHITSNRITCDLDTLMWRVGSESFTHREVAEMCWRHHSHLPVALFVVTFQELARRLRVGELSSIADRLLCGSVTPAAVDELHAFIRLIEHPNTDHDRHAYYVATFRQLVWQVKRKLRGLSTYWDTMPVLVGPQAAGKSSAVAKFAAPLQLLYMADGDFDIFTDGFRVTSLHRYYLICLDEMGRARHADLEKVKQKITANTVQARAMRSEQERKLPRHASFIGTSNTHLVNSIHDSGMRRFVEISCREERVDVDWIDAIKRINFNLLWECETGLDETAPLSLVTELNVRYQAELVITTPFDDFVETHITTCDDSVLTSLKSIYARYAAYEAIQSRRPMSVQLFAKNFEKRFGMGLRPQNKRYWRGLQLTDEDVSSV